MEHTVILALVATLGTWFVTALGAATVILIRCPGNRIMNLMLGFSAGVMVAASFWSLLQPAVERAQTELNVPAWLVVTAGFVVGALFMWVSDKIVSHARRNVDQAGGDDKRSFNRVIMLVLSITLHNIPEGLAVGVAFGALHSGASPEALAGAVTVAVGIGLQNFPEGAAVSLPLRREGFSRWRSFLVGQSSGMVEPVAGVIGAASVVHMGALLPYALSFAAGAMVLVAVHELIPECQQNQAEDPYLATMGIVAGFATMMLLDVALG
ncbi:MAG: ZIP family metal transporter [Eubacteriales bacterium]|nr:ZIP family metal transporter [Eubacteriales bacterium]MDY4899096.1 ZIP family metal transporter [Eubacteriales bacterium]